MYLRSELAPNGRQLELVFDCCCCYLFPQVFTFSLRNDAHPYIGDNVMGTHFHRFININDSEYDSFHWLFAVGSDEPPSQKQQPLPFSSSTNGHWSVRRTLCAGRSLMPAAPRRATISTVTAIAVIMAARRRDGGHGGPTVRAAVAAGSLTPDGRAGLPGTAISVPR